MAGLTTHILDTSAGTPAAGVSLRLFRKDAADGWELVREAETNADGRCDAPLLAPEAATAGQYRLEFDAGDYFRRSGTALAEPAFLDVVTIDFGIADPAAHYHVPLLLAPYGYSTYRGS
ncbi:MAG: hydroxyisourate hydrolase [Pseudomonadota bacterium]